MKIFIAFGVFVSLATGSVAFAHGGESHVSLSSPPVPYEAGEEVSVAVTLEALEPATSFEIPIAYDTAALKVTSVQVNSEDFPFWWKQEAADGRVQLAASAPLPGVSGEVVVATILFQALGAGSALPAIELSPLVLNAQDENILEPVQEAQAQPAAGVETSYPSGSNTGLFLLLGALGAAVLVGVAVVVKKKNAAK